MKQLPILKIFLALTGLFILTACTQVNINFGNGTPEPGSSPSPGPESAGTAIGLSLTTEGTRQWSDGVCACNCEEYRNPQDTTYAYSGATGSGLYKIQAPGSPTPLTLYCDMASTPGEGWTLVLLNSSYYQHPTPNWVNAISANNITGNMQDGLNGGFDQLLGLRYWTDLGSTLRIEVGAGPTTLEHRAFMSFSLDPNNNYTIHLSEPIITIGPETERPGFYSGHNGKPFSTSDRRNDTYSTSCTSYYGQAPWWYYNCWSGSFWGGGTGGRHANAPFWEGSSISFGWGAFWIR